MTTAQLVRVQGEGVADRPDGAGCGAGAGIPPWRVPAAPTTRPRPGTVDDRHRRVVAAALQALEEQGLAATTADDIARRAGCSRATVYRLFPGGKDAVVAAVVAAEVDRCLTALGAALAVADTLEDALVAAIVGAGGFVTGHRALHRLLAHEPEVVLPLLAFEQEERILAVAAAWVAPFLDRWLDPPVAVRVGEWAARLVDVYGFDTGTADHLADEAWVRHLVRTAVLPGVEAMVRASGPAEAMVRASAGAPARHRPHSDRPPTGTDSKGAAP